MTPNQTAMPELPDLPKQTTRHVEVLGMPVVIEGYTSSQMREYAIEYARAAIETLSQQGEPIAYVPVHPRNGPLWANTITSKDQDRPSYPLMDLYAAPPQAEAATVADELTIPQPGQFGTIGRKWIAYAQEDRDPNDIAFAVWNAIAETRAAPVQPAQQQDHRFAKDCNADTFNQSDVDGYIRFLTWSVWRDHYRETSPNFVLLSETLGVLTQLDNMLTGWKEQQDQSHPVAGERDRIDAERYRRVRAIVGAMKSGGWRQMFHLERLAPVDGANLFEGSVAPHFDEAVDAARAAQGKA